MNLKYRDQFYWERDRRTRAFGVETDVLGTPVRIHVGADAANSPAGQALALAVINMVSRIHRRVEIVLPDVGLLVPSLVSARTLREAGESLAVGIDPFIDLAAADDGSGPTLAIGNVPGTYGLGADGYIGHLSDVPTEITDHPASMVGAAMAACLGAAALLLSITGGKVRSRSVSLWNFGEPPIQPGPANALGPVDVGDRVVLVGAGAVGSAVLYWLRLLGVAGDWIVIDGDVVELHNTNRSMGMLALHAGWVDGVPNGVVANKAEIGASLIGAESAVAWYDDWVKDPGPRPDLLIPAGGEHNIRRTLGQLGLPLMIQGATSPSWQAQLHRHAPADGCPACRFRNEPTPQTVCAEGPLPNAPGTSTEDESTDAALPFLSAAAGLLVVAALNQFESGYLDQPVNQHALLLGSGTQVDWLPTITKCRPGCKSHLAPSVRHKLNVGKRWAHIDDQS